MPRFAQIADMVTRYGAQHLAQLSDGPDADTPDAARVTRALDDADALIDGYVARRHADTTRFDGHPLLMPVAVALAYDRLWTSDRPDHVKQDTDRAMKTLDAVSAGRILLDRGTEAEAPRPGQIAHSSGRVFDRDSLGGF